MAKHGRGLICLPMTAERLDELDIPLMVAAEHLAASSTAFCVSIEAEGRRPAPASPPPIARATVLAAIDPQRRARRTSRGPGTCSRCGRATGGVLVRAGQTEAAVDLARIAGLYPAGVICEIMNDDGTMARVPELTKFAQKHKLLMITIADLIQYRMRTEAAGPARRVGGPADRARRRSACIAYESLHRPTRRTSRSCAARSATARTSSCACTRSA